MQRFLWGLASLATLASNGALAQQGDGTRVEIRTAVVLPAKVDATDERIKQLKVPAGFTIAPFATGLKNARILAVNTDGTIYVSRRDQGDVLMLKDTNSDGRADGAPMVVANRAGTHGSAINDGKLYLVTVKEVFVADILGDGKLGPLTMLAAMRGHILAKGQLTGRYAQTVQPPK